MILIRSRHAYMYMHELSQRTLTWLLTDRMCFFLWDYSMVVCATYNTCKKGAMRFQKAFLIIMMIIINDYEEYSD